MQKSYQGLIYLSNLIFRRIKNSKLSIGGSFTKPIFCDLVRFNVYTLILVMALEDAIKQKKFRSEYQKLMINLIYTGNWINEKESILFKQYDLTGPQYNVLRILKGQYPQPATVNLIIERMLDRMSNASRIVDRLERKGLVLRKQCKNDRRAVDVIITEKGLEVLDKIDAKIDWWENSFTNLTLNEAHQMNSLLDKLRAGDTLKN